MKKSDATFLSKLKDNYNLVVNITSNISEKEIRNLCAAATKKAFDETDFEIRGSENLPYEQGVIFIYNHLDNHPYYTVDDDFQITLDSHFISSLILNKYYQDPGIRVSRYSLEGEKNHHAYYNRLGFIRVYAKDFTPAHLDPEEVKNTNKQFYEKATNVLESKKNMVFSPEGYSYSTDDSPGPFNEGIFKLACGMKNDPLIVPVVMANFDKLASETTFKCEIKPPFRLSEQGVNSANDSSFPLFIKNLNKQYKNWVYELKQENINFKLEIETLKNSVDKIKEKEGLVVFYGSSTIRLWKNLKEDFSQTNFLNLGFGGAFIHSLSEFFETLFQFENPKAIVLYLGGNDLTLGFSPEQIFEKIKKLIFKIKKKYPNVLIFNVSVKPSLERINDLDKIKKINNLLKNQLSEINGFTQIDVYESLLKDGEVNKDLLLQDGLHFNEEGYKVLKHHIELALKKQQLIA